MKKKIGLTVLYFLGLIALYGVLAWIINMTMIVNAIFELWGMTMENRIIDYIMLVIGVLLIAGLTANLILGIIKIWKLSPKELKEREENRLIKVEMEQQKEKERLIFEIKKKKEELDKLENKSI